MKNNKKEEEESWKKDYKNISKLWSSFKKKMRRTYTTR